MNKNEYLDSLLLRWDKNLNEQRKSSLTSREQAIKKFENLKNRISDKINKTNNVEDFYKRVELVIDVLSNDNPPNFNENCKSCEFVKYQDSNK